MSQITFEQFQQSLITNAKEIQGENYAGDEYYLDICWQEHWRNGDDPRESVLGDMDYWEPEREDGK